MPVDLQEAWLQHQRGLFRQAELGYRTILAGDPNNPDALHLLGVLSFQCGNPSQAAELIGRAVSLNPKVAEYYINLAEVYRALGQPYRSVIICRSAIRLHPDNPRAYSILGSALLANGDAASSLDAFHEALRLKPDYAMAHNNLGSAYRHLKQEADALVHFRQAISIDPALVEARSNLGQLLLETNDLEGALIHCQEAVRLRPNFAEAHNNLGNVYRALERFDEAEACYEESLRINPGLAMTYNNLGQLFHGQSRFEKAAHWYRLALERDPNSPLLHFNLATALTERGRDEDAIIHYRSAIRLQPGHAEAHHGLGMLYHYHGWIEEAKSCFDEAVRLDPRLAAAHASLGGIHEEYGDFDAALASLRESLRLDPRNAGALTRLAAMLRGRLPKADEAALREKIADPALPDAKRWPLLFGLAQVLDAHSEFDEAADVLQRANALRKDDFEVRGRVYNRASHREYVDDVIATFSSEYFARNRDLGSDSVRPIFIIGLPRSGTTLVEQVLASHPRVHGAGELTAIPLLFEQLPSATKHSGTPMECLADPDPSAIKELAVRYLEQLSGLNASAERVVDKMPHNYLYLGFMHLLFPNATFIHCRRDLRDVALSCWITNFAQVNWTNDPDDIASRFAEYRRLMNHWQVVLPGAVLDVDYESLVADTERVARELLAWCKLQWDPRCLEFHKTERVVRTASVSQVRQPVYSRSVGRWKNYEKHLGTLFEAVI